MRRGPSSQADKQFPRIKSTTPRPAPACTPAPRVTHQTLGMSRIEINVAHVPGSYKWVENHGDGSGATGRRKTSSKCAPTRAAMDCGRVSICRGSMQARCALAMAMAYAPIRCDRGSVLSLSSRRERRLPIAPHSATIRRGHEFPELDYGALGWKHVQSDVALQCIGSDWTHQFRIRRGRCLSKSWTTCHPFQVCKWLKATRAVVTHTCVP